MIAEKWRDFVLVRRVIAAKDARRIESPSRLGETPARRPLVVVVVIIDESEQWTSSGTSAGEDITVTVLVVLVRALTLSFERRDEIG